MTFSPFLLLLFSSTLGSLWPLVARPADSLLRVSQLNGVTTDFPSSIVTGAGAVIT